MPDNRAAATKRSDAPTDNSKLLAWVDEMAKLTQPDEIVWCDGSEQEKQRLTKLAVDKGILIPLNAEKRRGSFVCAACFLPLFSSDAKFESGTGWPSYFEPITGNVATKRDWKLVLPRTEYHCSRCGGHQGHVFNDGPAPTGQRWCNNGVALRFVPEGETLPAPRTSE